MEDDWQLSCWRFNFSFCEMFCLSIQFWVSVPIVNEGAISMLHRVTHRSCRHVDIVRLSGGSCNGFTFTTYPDLQLPILARVSKPDPSFLNYVGLHHTLVIVTILPTALVNGHFRQDVAPPPAFVSTPKPVFPIVHLDRREGDPQLGALFLIQSAGRVSLVHAMSIPSGPSCHMDSLKPQRIRTQLYR